MVLPKAVVIVASRPAAAAKFRSVASRQVEVIGFLKDQISDYVNNYPFSDVKNVKNFTSILINIQMYITCAIFLSMLLWCAFFSISLDTDLPQTETEIYKEFTKFTILRILVSHEEHI